MCSLQDTVDVYPPICRGLGNYVHFSLSWGCGPGLAYTTHQIQNFDLFPVEARSFS